MKVYYFNKKGEIIDVVEVPVFWKRRQFQDCRYNREINGGFFNGEESYWDRICKLFCTYN
jgi:hypothetical protein